MKKEIKGMTKEQAMDYLFKNYDLYKNEIRKSAKEEYGIFEKCEFNDYLEEYSVSQLMDMIDNDYFNKKLRYHCIEDESLHSFDELHFENVVDCYFEELPIGIKINLLEKVDKKLAKYLEENNENR